MNRAVPLTIGAARGCNNFRKWLIKTRIAKNETQEDLATDIDMDRKSIMAYELGQRVPGLDDVLRIAEHYGLNEITISLKEELTERCEDE